ncbi:MAG: peptidoglycan-N-acetylglucosamine deacetylase [Sphingomonadales bacterium]|nr:peptidoglycan-N-acetylglucosamine deacetylase [Sphingomonadales bacterium]
MTRPAYLFSVDVEDPRLDLPDGDRFPARVPALVDTYLDFLRRHEAKGSFFVVGEVARRHPEMIARIAAEGHELGCHSDSHVPLDRLGQARFRDDLLRNLEALDRAGAGAIKGYRAPCFSMTAQTGWAYEALAELGFAYSSSVLPARSPLYGQPGFGARPRLIEDVVELPVTLLPFRWLKVPVGGLYFRVLPRFVLRRALARRRRAGETVASYHHPYDIDTEQAFTHAGFRRWGAFDLLMRANRGSVLPRLEMAKSLGFAFTAYGDHARRIGEELRSNRGENG